MKLGKLTKRFKKELAAHPKQAAVLGLACLAALWFYAPLVTTWIKGKPGKPKNIAALANGSVAPSMTTAAVAASSWLEMNDWRQADPLTRPASLAMRARNPFTPPEITTKTEVAEVTPIEQKTVAPAEVDPSQLGLALQAISIGPKRFAQISGKTVKENDILSLPSDAGSTGQARLKVCVASITATEVVLKVGDQSVRLKMPKKSLGSDEVFIGVGSRK